MKVCPVCGNEIFVTRKREINKMHCKFCKQELGITRTKHGIELFLLDDANDENES